MKQYHILLVEDDVELSEYYQNQLNQRGYLVTAAKTIKQAQTAITAGQFHLLLLDIMLPDGSGIDWCKKVRKFYPGPILFLTSLGESGEIIRGLQSGGDDYIIKPCRMDELAARIAAHLKRVERFQSEITRPMSRLMLNVKTWKAYLDGEEMRLKPKEYQLLYLLVTNRHRYMTAEQLYQQVWNMKSNGDIRTIWVHISNLRKKLAVGDQEPVIDIEHEKNKGYRIVEYDDEKFMNQ